MWTVSDEYGFQTAADAKPADSNRATEAEQAVPRGTPPGTQADAATLSHASNGQAGAAVRQLNEAERQAAIRHGAWWLSELNTRLRRYVANPSDGDRLRVLLVQINAYRDAVLAGAAVPPQVDR